MRPETRLWLEQGSKDLEVAKKNHTGKDYYVSVFLCQQAVEKSLKALFIDTKKLSPGTTHSLVYLGKETNVPKKHFSLLQDLAPEFVATQYPDIADEAPYLLYSKEKSENYLERATELLSWIHKQIQK